MTVKGLVNLQKTPIDWKDRNERNRMSKAPSKNSKYLPTYEGFKTLLDENMQEAHMTSFELFEILIFIYFIF